MCEGKCEGKQGSCILAKTANVLLIIGGLNWGLVGLGMFMHSDFNLVHLIFWSWPVVEAIIYLLVGVSALVKIFGCRCKKCMTCSVCAADAGMNKKTEGKM